MTAPVVLLVPSVRAEQTASPALIAFAELLACPLQDVEAVIDRELARNPALERVDTGTSGARTAGRREASAERLGAPLEAVAWVPGATEALLAEVGMLVGRSDRALAAWILGELDDRGFLLRPAERLATELCVPLREIHRIITVIREVGPAGICAGDLSECLLLQLERLGADVPPLVEPIVRFHLPDLAAGRVDRVAAALVVPREDVLAARAFLRARLRPSAAPEPAGPAPAPPPPDVVLRWSGPPERNVEVRLPEPASGRIAVNPFWDAVAGGAHANQVSPAERRTLRAQAEQGRAFLDQLAERDRTLQEVAAYTATRQLSFLRHGPAAQIPLTRAAVADALRLSESTVSRAVTGKYVRTPGGRTIPFAAFFGAAASAEAALEAMVRSEVRPLSDAELAARLRAAGHVVARRTVAKYRERLGILPCRQR